MSKRQRGAIIRAIILTVGLVMAYPAIAWARSPAPVTPVGAGIDPPAQLF